MAVSAEYLVANFHSFAMVGYESHDRAAPGGA